MIRCREDALAFLMGRINFERSATVPYGQRQLKLDRMRQLLTRLGNPDAGLPIVHVAGTKGKGSTSALIASVLSAAGYETGLFSSPHLDRIEERFAVNGLPCTGDELAVLVERLRPVVQTMDRESALSDDASMSPTYFEVTTALALMHFAQRKVDMAILEVGLGGRLDSTNVCQPVVTVISSISFDHTKQLGNTLAKIAREKAGIIKPGVPVLCGHMLDEPHQVIANVAQQHGCRMLSAGADFCSRYRSAQLLNDWNEMGRFDFQANEVQLSDIPLRLMGKHQAANAALALATIMELRKQGWSVSQEAIYQGMAELSLPGRFEIVGHQPTVVLDVAHNVASAEALVDVLQDCMPSQDRVLVLAVSRDKDVRGIVRALLPYFRHLVVTEYRENPRAVPSDELFQIVREEHQGLGTETSSICLEKRPLPVEAWKLALQIAGEDQLICVTGSFFIVAELRGALLANVETE